MSNGRRFWLPNQKGSELFPNVTQAPARLVIRGVPPNTPLYRAIANTFSGPLKTFHAKSQQAYALSNDRIQRNAYDWGDARARYTNINGQETLELEVSTSVVEAIYQELQERGDKWDWALIKIETPNTNNGDGVLGAVIKAFRRIPGPGERTLKFAGFAFDQGEVFPDDGLIYFSDGMDPFSVSFADRNNPIQIISVSTGATQITTLLVDLRHFPSSTTVIDFHGFLAMAQVAEEQVIGYSRGPGPNTSTVSYLNLGAVTYPSGWPFDPGGNQAHFTNLGFPVATTDAALAPLFAMRADQTLTTPSHVYIPAPALTFTLGGSATGWSDTDIYDGASGLLTGLTEYTYYQHFDPVSGSSSSNSFLATNVLHWNISELLFDVPTPAPAEVRSAPISGVGGFGWPTWVATAYDAPFVDFGQWDISQLLPRHLQMGKMGECTIDSNYDLDSNAPYKPLGSVTIDPVLKSISFEKAR